MEELKEEVVDGVGLTFKDAIEFHRSNGNPELAEQIRALGIAEIKTVKNVMIVGESHIRTIVDEENEKQFQQSIGQAEVIVIEHDALSGNPYSAASPEKRFMQEAQEEAITKGKELIVLDLELGTDWESKYALVRQELPIEKKEYAYMTSMNTLVQEFIQGTSIDKIRNGLGKRLVEVLAEDQVVAIIDEVTTDYFNALLDLKKLGEVQKIITNFKTIDDIAREQGYQRKVSEIASKNPDRKIAVVLGKSHLEPVVRAVSESYVTPQNSDVLDSFREARSNLKKS